MRNTLRLAVLGLATSSLLAACLDDDTSLDITEKVKADGTRILRGSALTPPSASPARTIAVDFVRGRVGHVADQLRVVGETSSRGITHVLLAQHVDGLRVHGAYVKAAVDGSGQLLQVIEKLGAGSPGKPTVGPRDALALAFGEHGYVLASPAEVSSQGNVTRYAKSDELYREPSVERVAYIDAQGQLRPGYLVETWSMRGNQLDHTLVDGQSNRIVATERRTNNDSYRVFVEDPLKGAQTVVAGPGAGNAESPAGWLAGAQTTIHIRGNNARAYLDTDANNTADAGGSAVTDGNFLAAADLAAQPSTTGNRAVAVQNLFYLNNVVHDRLYRHGFTAAAGNFQVDNFGLGGAGNDPVNAEAQDGSGTDNANMATPADGSSPRMQMYLWTGSTPSGVVTVGAASYGLAGSSFGPALTTTGTTAALAIYADAGGTSGDPNDACEASTGSLAGKLAIVKRGNCNFTVKVANAQAAGALGVIITNTEEAAFGPGGTDRKVKIPSGMVTLADGNALRGLVGQSATLKKSTAVALQIDGDLDADIVAHEYGHGLTWRMIGNMSGPMSGAIGEGASDVVAFLMNGDDRIGEYAYSNPAGIRRQPYRDYVGTYSSVTGGEVHNDGEIYAAAMYQVMENYLAAGLTIDDVFDDFVGGMDFTPAGPAFEDMRDGMLSAAPDARDCLIWRGFAQYGIGVGADGGVNRRGQVIVTQSLAVPAACN